MYHWNRPPLVRETAGTRRINLFASIRKETGLLDVRKPAGLLVEEIEAEVSSVRRSVSCAMSVHQVSQLKMTI
jgi:hypothetical protein